MLWLKSFEDPMCNLNSILKLSAETRITADGVDGLTNADPPTVKRARVSDRSTTKMVEAIVLGGSFGGSSHSYTRCSSPESVKMAVSRLTEVRSSAPRRTAHWVFCFAGVSLPS